MKNKIYIGDGAYARIDEFGALVLTTENSISVDNTVVLEPEVIAVLGVWLKANFPEHSVLISGGSRS